MKNILIITKITLREAFSRKIFIAFAGISTFVLLLFTILSITISLDDFGDAFKVQGEAVRISENIAEILKLIIVTPLFGGGLFLSIFSASSFIPHMLEKGNIDLLLSKPISRAQLILGKFLGGNLVVLLNIAYLVTGIWLLIGLKFGEWAPSFFLTILSISFAFATIYALIILIGILSRSSVLAMMISYLIFFILSPVLSNRDPISIFWIINL
jgi:ABC-2 type transport system permease protein